MLPIEWNRNIRKKEKFPWDLLPWISRTKTVTALWPYVFVPPLIYDNLNSSEPNPLYLSIMAHEFTHIEREEEKGVLRWLVLYLISSHFRIEEELIADEATMKYMVDNGIEFDVEARAKMLSGWIYLHGINYEQAEKQLRERWEKVKISKDF
jgi:hypothetical protein